MRRTLTDAEQRWAENFHSHWTRQCEAEGWPVPAEPIVSLMEAAIIGMSRLHEATDEAIERAQREAAQMARDGHKAN